MAKSQTSLTIERDLIDWLNDTQGKGNISTYVESLIRKSKSNQSDPLTAYKDCVTRLEKEEKKLELINSKLLKMSIEEAIDLREKAKILLEQEKVRIDAEKRKYGFVVDLLKKTEIYPEFIKFYNLCNGNPSFEELSPWIQKFGMDYNITLDMFSFRKIHELDLLVKETK